MNSGNAITAADQAYIQLRRRILQRQYDAGGRLAETELAGQLGVSRTPVREALRRLAEDGFVVLAPNQGARVAAPTLKGMIQA